MIKKNVYSVQLECPCSWSATCISLFVTCSDKQGNRKLLCSELTSVCVFCFKCQVGAMSEYT